MELLGAAAAGSRIYAVWEHVFEIYDARTGTWRAGPPPQVPRHALSAFVSDGRLYAVGGCRTPALVDSQAVEQRPLSGL
jgi:hypothetical protein